MKAKIVSWMESKETERLKEREYNLKTLNLTILEESHRISLDLKNLEQSLTKAETALSTEGKGNERLLWGMNDFLRQQETQQQQEMQGVLPKARQSKEVREKLLLGEPMFKVSISLCSFD